MKLCYVADGTSIHIQRWLNYFADTGHEVHLICWKNANGYHQNVHVHMLENLIPRRWYLSKYLNFIYWCVQVRSLVRTISPDVLDGHYASVYGFIAACADFHPLVITAWGSDLLVEARSPLGRFMVKYGMKKADSVLCTGPAVLQEILKLGIAPNKVHSVVLGGINTEQFYPMSNSEVLRNSLNIGTDEPVIISTRHLASIRTRGATTCTST